MKHQNEETMTLDDVADRMVELEAENKFLRWTLALAVVTSICALASRFLA